MTLQGKGTKTGFGQLLSGTAQLAEWLPTASEKSELIKNISDLISFLSDVRDLVGLLPSKEETAYVHESIGQLKALWEKHRSNPVVLSALGAFPKQVAERRAKSHPISSWQAKELIDSLANLSVYEIRGRLGSSQYSVAQLKAMAQTLGIRSVSKLSGDSLAHQLLAKIANFRGYQRLGELGTKKTTE